MDKKTFLAIALSLLLVMTYQYFFVTPPVPDEAGPAPAVIADAGEQQVSLSPESERTETSRVQRSLVRMDDDAADDREIRVESPLYRAVFSTRGAGIVSLQLKNYRKTLSEDSDLIELVNVRPGMHAPLAITFPESNIDIPSGTRYEADRNEVNLAGGAREENLVFTWVYPGEIKVEKKYTFHSDSYAIGLELKVTNLSNATITQNAEILWNEYVDPDAGVDRYSHTGPVAYVNDSLETLKLKNVDQPQYFGPEVLWGGYENKYFIAAVISDQPTLTRMAVSRSSKDVISVSLQGPRNLIPPGQWGVFEYTCYLGPKEYDILKEQNVFLEASIDFGSWIKWLALPLLKGLKLINGYVDNYGLAIIILTIFIKLLFWPLGTISYRSMKNMQKLQPEMMKIREKYKDDKAKIQEETMSLYRTHKVNPLSGCLPIMIQIPVFFGLYRALLYSIELRHSPFIFWIQDLSAKDPYYVTPIIMGFTMFLQQKMMPTPGGNELQAKIMTWMPVVFTFLFLNFPAGLVIYWLFNNILSVGQQYWINKRT